MLSLEQELADVERQIAKLRIDYERFFAGELKLMPAQGRRRLNDQFKQLWTVEVERAADRFRRQTLQEKFTTLSELWDKKIRAREEGRRLAQREATDPIDKIVKPGDGSASATVKAKAKPDFRPLFDRYKEAREAAGEDVTKLNYERFEELVKKQAEEIRKRSGSPRLVFEVRTEGGKVRLVGRPAPPKG